MLHHPTKNAATTAVRLCAGADRKGRSPFAALIAAAVLALLALGLVPGAALAQTETTAPDPAAPAPPETGTAGEEADPQAGEDGIKMPGIRVSDDCTKVGPIKVGDCGGSGDKDPPAEPPAADPTADPLAPDQYGSTSPEEPTPDAAENPLSDPMMEQCDVLYPVGGTTGGRPLRRRPRSPRRRRPSRKPPPRRRRPPQRAFPRTGAPRRRTPRS